MACRRHFWCLRLSIFRFWADGNTRIPPTNIPATAARQLLWITGLKIQIQIQILRHVQWLWKLIKPGVARLTVILRSATLRIQKYKNTKIQKNKNIKTQIQIETTPLRFSGRPFRGERQEWDDCRRFSDILFLYPSRDHHVIISIVSSSS